MSYKKIDIKNRHVLTNAVLSGSAGLNEHGFNVEPGFFGGPINNRSDMVVTAFKIEVTYWVRDGYDVKQEEIIETILYPKRSVSFCVYLDDDVDPNYKVEWSVKCVYGYTDYELLTMLQERIGPVNLLGKDITVNNSKAMLERAKKIHRYDKIWRTVRKAIVVISLPPMGIWMQQKTNFDYAIFLPILPIYFVCADGGSTADMASDFWRKCVNLPIGDPERQRLMRIFEDDYKDRTVCRSFKEVYSAFTPKTMQTWDSDGGQGIKDSAELS